MQRHSIAIKGNGMVCMASQGNGNDQQSEAKQRNGEASQRKATALNRAHLTERQWHGNEPLISDEQWHGRSKRRKLGYGNSKHSMNGKEILRRNTMDRLKVGDEVAIAAIVKITAIQPQNNGTVSYSTDRGISIHEELLEQIKIKPRENPTKPLYSGTITATAVRPAGQNSPDAYNRIGRVFEFKDGLLVGDRNSLCATYGFALQPEFTYESFEDFTKHHTLNDWIELKS